MELLEAIQTPHLTIVAAGLLAVLIAAVTMGLFGKNRMPVDGKVCFFTLLHIPRSRPHVLTRAHRPFSSQEALRAWD